LAAAEARQGTIDTTVLDSRPVKGQTQISFPGSRWIPNEACTSPPEPPGEAVPEACAWTNSERLPPDPGSAQAACTPAAT
jgi:hypothetical protein